MTRVLEPRAANAMRSLIRAVLACMAVTVVTGDLASSAETRTLDDGEVMVERMASRLKVPWGLAFLPDCEFLVSLRQGSLVHFDGTGKRTTVEGVPRVRADGQGGLLDVEAARDFVASREIFLTYSKRQRRGTGTALAIARLSDDGSRLEDIRTVFEMLPGSRGGRHFGSRVVEAPDGSLFVTIGDRGDRESAQDLASHNGTVVRIGRDGSVPSDNPFVDVENARPEIWTYGHRNPQGAAFDASGVLWTSEHGARGGDEVNRIERGSNYGWPIISYGVHYSGRKIGIGVAAEGMEQPAWYWDPSIAPGGNMIYSGKLWPEWSGNMFVGSLKFDLISRLSMDGELREVERIAFPESRRVRHVREAPDGSIWFLSEDREAVYRMTPASLPRSETPVCPTRSR